MTGRTSGQASGNLAAADCRKHVQKVMLVEGLDQMAIHARREAGVAVVWRAVRREGNDVMPRQPLLRLKLAQPSHRFVAIDARHFNIQQHAVKQFSPADKCNGFPAGRRRGDVMAIANEQGAGKEKVDGRVIN